MNDQWQAMTDSAQLDRILSASKAKPQLIFKHSTRCPMSMAAYKEVEEATGKLVKQADILYVDVIENREVSQLIAQRLDVTHQSPQVILLTGGKVAWDGSHSEVLSDMLIDAVAKVAG